MWQRGTSRCRPRGGLEELPGAQKLVLGYRATSPSLPTLLLGSPWLLSSAKQKPCAHICCNWGCTYNKPSPSHRPQQQPQVPCPQRSRAGAAHQPEHFHPGQQSHAGEGLAPATYDQGAKTKRPPRRHGQTDRHGEGLRRCRRPSCEVQEKEQQDRQGSGGPHVSSASRHRRQPQPPSPGVGLP